MAAKKPLALTDVGGLIVCWVGVAGVVFGSSYLIKQGDMFIVAIVGIAAGYYLSKWIITGESSN